jgi:hypothetical protein
MIEQLAYWFHDTDPWVSVLVCGLALAMLAAVFIIRLAGWILEKPKRDFFRQKRSRTK